jgi:hypothetical protein
MPGRTLFCSLVTLIRLLLVAVLDRVLPDGQTLDLINIAFGHDATAVDACTDRITTIHGYHELDALSSGRRDFHIFCRHCSPAEADQVLESHVRHLLYPCEKPMDASVGTALWLAARGQGIVQEANEGAYKGTIDQRHYLGGIRLMLDDANITCQKTV